MQCGVCGNETSFIEEHSRWYCYTCEYYLEEEQAPRGELIEKRYPISKPAPNSSHFLFMSCQEMIVVRIDTSPHGYLTESQKALDQCETIEELKYEFSNGWIIPHSVIDHIDIKDRTILGPKVTVGYLNAQDKVVTLKFGIDRESLAELMPTFQALYGERLNTSWS